jgi:hypothetical protein
MSRRDNPKREVTMNQINARFPNDTCFNGTECEFVREDGQYAVYMSGYYTAPELREMLHETLEANRFYNAMETVLVRLEAIGYDPANLDDPRSFVVKTHNYNWLIDQLNSVPYECVAMERGVVLEKPRYDTRHPTDMAYLLVYLDQCQREYG